MNSKFLFVILALASLLVLSGCNFPQQPVCGNNICESPPEDQYNCPADCGKPQTCTDSDGGKIYGVKGEMSINGDIQTDFCQGSKLNEYYCAGNVGAMETVDCENYGGTCSDGACVTAPKPVSITLVDSKGYPYDSTDTTGIYDYVVSITASGTKLQKIKITNSREKWNNSTSTRGPMYPTNSGQSLTGKTGTVATYGQILGDGTLGKGYASAEFLGFEGKEEMTTVTIGNSVTGLDSGAKGGIEFRGADDALHQIPFALELDDSETGSTFVFDGKTIWYDVNYGTSSSPGTNYDLNFLVRNGDYVNGRNWTITYVGGDYLRVNVEGWGYFMARNIFPTYVTIDGVNYSVERITNTLTDTLVRTDASIEFRHDNSTGSLIYNQKGNTSSQSYGKMFLSDGLTFDGNSITAASAPVNIGIAGNGDRKTYYAVRAGQSINRLWLLLDNGFLGADESNKIQNGKQIIFRGTAVPNEDGTETGVVNRFYYVPQDTDFNSAGIYSNSSAYFVAKFQAVDMEPGSTVPKFINVYIDTKNGGNIGPFTNSNLSYFTADAENVEAGFIKWSLKSGNASDYLKAAYTDAGTKALLLGNDNGVSVSMPENAQKVQIIVSGPNVEITVEGETVVLKEGQTGTTPSGTVMTYAGTIGVSGFLLDVTEGGQTERLTIIRGTYSYTSWGSKFGISSVNNDGSVAFIKVLRTTYGAGSKEYKTPLRSQSGSMNIEVPNANDVNSLTDAQLPHLFNFSVSELVNGVISTPVIQEKIGINVDSKMDTSSDIRDLVSYIEGGDFYYQSIIGSDGIDLGTTDFTADGDDDITIILFGESYKLKSAKLGGNSQIMLEKAIGSFGGAPPAPSAPLPPPPERVLESLCGSGSEECTPGDFGGQCYDFGYGECQEFPTCNPDTCRIELGICETSC